MNKIEKFGVLFAGLVALALVWSYFKVDPAPVKTWTPATKAPQVAAIPHQDITPPHVSVYASAAKKKLDLSPEVQADPHKHVLDAAVVPGDGHPITIIPLFDDQTGGVQMFVRHEPSPWLAAEQRGYIRFGYGIKNEQQQVGRLAGSINLVQIKAFHAGFDGTLDTDWQRYVGAHIELGL